MENAVGAVIEHFLHWLLQSNLIRIHVSGEEKHKILTQTDRHYVLNFCSKKKHSEARFENFFSPSATVGIKSDGIHPCFVLFLISYYEIN